MFRLDINTLDHGLFYHNRDAMLVKVLRQLADTIEAGKADGHYNLWDENQKQIGRMTLTLNREYGE
jgi:hypothetical protein